MQFFSRYYMNRAKFFHRLTFEPRWPCTHANLKPSTNFTRVNFEPIDLLHEVELTNQDEILHELISNQKWFYIEMSLRNFMDILMAYIHKPKDRFFYWWNSRTKHRLPRIIPKLNKSFDWFNSQPENFL